MRSIFTKCLEYLHRGLSFILECHFHRLDSFKEDVALFKFKKIQKNQFFCIFPPPPRGHRDKKVRFLTFSILPSPPRCFDPNMSPIGQKLFEIFEKNLFSTDEKKFIRWKQVFPIRRKNDRQMTPFNHGKWTIWTPWCVLCPNIEIPSVLKKTTSRWNFKIIAISLILRIWSLE